MGTAPVACGTRGQWGNRASAPDGRVVDAADFNQIVHGGTPWPNGISSRRLVQTRKSFDNRTPLNDNRALYPIGQLPPRGVRPILRSPIDFNAASDAAPPRFHDAPCQETPP
jgi:hypothetical protein